MADRDDLHLRFIQHAAESAVDAIDDATLSSSGRSLFASTKDQIREILAIGFAQVLQDKRIGDSGSLTAQRVWVAIDPRPMNADGANDLESEITKEVYRAFANFADGLVGLTDDEIRRRER
jgi:hypothetical protein